MKNKKVLFTKFAIVALAIGFFSPSVAIQESKNYTGSTLFNTEITLSLLNQAEARRNGGANRNRSANRNKNSNRNSNRNKNVNRNVNKNVNVNVNHRGGGRYYGGGSYHRGGAIAAGVVTGLVVGSIVASIPPSCNTVRVNNVEYRNCSGTYYQPYYQGSTLSYRVVNSPY